MNQEQTAEQRAEKQRTDTQNRALHLYFQLIADALNDAGLDMKTVLAPNIEIPWSKFAVKEYLWRPIQKAQIGKESTTELNTKDIDAIFETINRHLASHGMHEAFPSIEDIINKQREFNSYEKNTIYPRRNSPAGGTKPRKAR